MEQYRGFVRFSDIGGGPAAEIEPKNRVLPLLRGHFCQRCHDETFFLYDRTHREALFYADGDSAIVSLEEFVMAPPDEAEKRYRRLWRCFYDTIAIRERENPKLRMSHMPKRFWPLLTELQSDPDAIPRLHRRAELLQRPMFQPRYLHLRHAKHPRRLLLRQRLEKAQQDRHALPLRQQVDRRAKGKAARSGSPPGLSVPRSVSSVSPSPISC